MITYQDFVPRQTGAGGFLSFPTYENLDACVAEANQWIAANQVDVVNIETVLLPNMFRHGEEGTVDAHLKTSGEMHSTWHQFIRVWHRAERPVPPPF